MKAGRILLKPQASPMTSILLLVGVLKSSGFFFLVKWFKGNGAFRRKQHFNEKPYWLQNEVSWPSHSKTKENPRQPLVFYFFFLDYFSPNDSTKPVTIMVWGQFLARLVNLCWQITSVHRKINSYKISQLFGMKCWDFV